MFNLNFMKKILLSIFSALFFFTLSFSQQVDQYYRLFNYKSFYNSGKNYKITGIWCPSRIDQYNIMCIQAHEEYDTPKQWIMIPQQGMAESWISNLIAMKELLIKNDSIAKANGVTSNIQKKVSDKFNFSGFVGEGVARSSIMGPIKKSYSGRDQEYCVIVLYKYTDGKSSMELHIGDYYLQSTKLLWTFNKPQDFDEIIDAMNWSDFYAAFNKQVNEYKQQQEAVKDAAEKQKNESALFD